MSGVHLWGFLRMRLSGRGTRLAGRPASHAPSRSVALWGLLRPRSHGSGSPAGLQGLRASFRSCGSLAASPWSSRSGRHYPRPPSGGFNRSSTRVTVDRVGSSGELSGCQYRAAVSLATRVGGVACPAAGRAQPLVEEMRAGAR